MKVLMVDWSVVTLLNSMVMLVIATLLRSSRPKVFCEKGVLRNFANNFTKKETLAHVFSCEFCEISNIPFPTEHLRATASVSYEKLIANHY